MDPDRSVEQKERSQFKAVPILDMFGFMESKYHKNPLFFIIGDEREKSVFTRASFKPIFPQRFENSKWNISSDINRLPASPLV